MKSRYIVAAVSALALSGCSSNTVRDTLGLERSAPDEFRVVSRPPLSVPPQFDLRPPANSDASPNQLPADKQAQSIINGTNANAGSVKADTAVVPVTSADAPKTRGFASSPAKSNSGAESQFLKDAGADKADPKVRDTLTEEKYVVQEKKEESPWWDIFPSDTDKPDPQVDAKKEAQRIQQNQDQGKPVTTGDTPEIKGKDTGLWGQIFGN